MRDTIHPTPPDTRGPSGRTDPLPGPDLPAPVRDLPAPAAGPAAGPGAVLSDALRLGGLALLLALLSAAYLGTSLPASGTALVIELRAVRLGSMLTVGAAVGVATVLFQTLTATRILTPSIMGFDALYIAIQTFVVAFAGAEVAGALPRLGSFAAEAGLMLLASMTLFLWLLRRRADDLPRLVLTGVILGVMLRSVSDVVARGMDPNAFAVVQSAVLASFGRADAELLALAAPLTLAVLGAALALAPRLDVLALGRPVAVGLGLAHRGMALVTLTLVALLVSVSTALVGPVSFFGLIVAGLAHATMRRQRHAALLPAAALIAGCVLVAGQFLFERLLARQGTLSVVIEFAGGLFFLWLLLRGKVR